MQEITFAIPEEAVLALDLPPEDLKQEILTVAAIKLYELGRLSSGAAAHLMGLSQPDFLSRLTDYGVDTFRLTEAELAEDLARA
jgi:predicted HTH domain antitoxin